MEQSLKHKIGNELDHLITQNATVIEISRWADNVYSHYCRVLDFTTEEIITKISFMQNGPEFEISKDDLLKISEELIK